MSSPIIWPAGLAGTGPTSATVLPDYFSAAAIFLSSITGNDANAGTSPELPVKTVAVAITNASAASVIAIGAGHTETISNQAIAKAGLYFCGFGTGANKPRFTPSSGATVMLNIQAGGIDTVFDNIAFGAAAATAGAAGRIASVASGTELYSCTMDCGAFDQEGLLLNTGADNARIDGCTFTAVAVRPTRAIALAGASNTNVKIINTIIDGGTFGWAGNALTVSNCIRFRWINSTLNGNSDISGTTAASYQFFGVNASSAGAVSIT